MVAAGQSRCLDGVTTSKIPARVLGKSGLCVPLLGFGCAPIGDLYDCLDDRMAIEAVTAAIEAGCSLIDTAPLYGHGLAEHRAGTAIRRAAGASVVVSTKVGRVLSPARGTWDREGYAGGLPYAATFDYSFDGAMRSLEQSLLRLGVARVDIALIHDLDTRAHGSALNDRFDEAVRGAYRALARLRDEGVVTAIGLAVNEADVCCRMAAVCDIDAVLLAGRYTLVEQGALDSFLPVAASRNIGVMLGGVFNSGVLATGAIGGARYDYALAPAGVLERVRRIERIAERFGVPLPAAAMQFAAAHPAVASLVVGAVNPFEVLRNVANLQLPIPSEFWSTLKGAGLLRPDAPVPD